MPPLPRLPNLRVVAARWALDHNFSVRAAQSYLDEIYRLPALPAPRAPAWVTAGWWAAGGGGAAAAALCLLLVVRAYLDKGGPIRLSKRCAPPPLPLRSRAQRARRREAAHRRCASPFRALVPRFPARRAPGI